MTPKGNSLFPRNRQAIRVMFCSTMYISRSVVQYNIGLTVFWLVETFVSNYSRRYYIEIIVDPDAFLVLFIVLLVKLFYLLLSTLL